MWTSFMNGSGLHGRGGAGGSGGGYVQSQGWEFVPCSGMERVGRGRGSKARSPLRRISSPPTVFSHIYEPHAFGASPGIGGGGGEGGGEGEPGTQLEIHKGQMWPGADPQLQQPTQHTRLKKKFEDLKKRHVQDKEEWMREKESLLREVADIQGGENRRILLDLKTVLEEVQVEVKREEEKRSELQLQYTRDRCAWELERTELKCRIAQLEDREGSGTARGGVQSAVGFVPLVAHPAKGQRGETPSLRHEREEQRRLLADTHSTAMDLRCRLEHNERDWLREKADLLERFDVERREWESQLRDMQRKIEELYCEVRAKRAGTILGSGRQDEDDVARGLSVHSTSTGSSLLSDNSRSEPLSSSSHSEPRRQPSPGFRHNRNMGSGGSVGRESHQSNCFQADGHCEFNVDSLFTQKDPLQSELVDGARTRSTWQKNLVDDRNDKADTMELGPTLHRDPGSGLSQKRVSNGNENDDHVRTQESLLWAELSYGSEKKKNTTALNAALKEIARVSEELCSYQDEIRQKSEEKRHLSESPYLTEESEMLFAKNRLEVDEPPCDLNQIYDDLRAMERENWITVSPDNTWRSDRAPSDSWRPSPADPHLSPGIMSELDTSAPPIPPRTSSWSLSNQAPLDTELYIPESPMSSVKKCHSPCVLVNRKCSSPSIVRKFEAMLQENEGKLLVDGAITSCSVPANSHCNADCCHNRWSCDASKYTNSKQSAYGTAQKSFSEVNILKASKDSDYNHCVSNLQTPDIQMPPLIKELPVDLLLSSLETTPTSPNLQDSRRNIMLEQKTAEFNRTLFQAEMGRSVKEGDTTAYIITDVSSLGCHISDEHLAPSQSVFQPHSDATTAFISVHPEVPLSVSTLNASNRTLEFQPKQRRCSQEGHEVKIKQETSSDLTLEQLQVKVDDSPTTSSKHNKQSPVNQSDFKLKVQTTTSASGKTQHRAATESSSESSEPANHQVGQDTRPSSAKNGAKPQPARVGVSLHQMTGESKQRQTTQPRQASASPPQSDSSRKGPRTMMNDHPWKPLTLAAYPRPEGSRSNYGAVERILKNYESAARAQQSQVQQNKAPSSPDLSAGQDESVTKLHMLDMDSLPSPSTLRHTQTSHSSQSLTIHSQHTCHTAMDEEEIQLIVQEDEESSIPSSSSAQKNFSRPARPANRRLPSRWASRSPTSSSSTSSSPSSTPVVPPSFPLQKHTSSFAYSNGFHIETVII